MRNGDGTRNEISDGLNMILGRDGMKYTVSVSGTASFHDFFARKYILWYPVFSL